MHISGQKKSHLKSGIRMKRNEIDESLRSLTIGFGFALCYTPALAMVGKYFSERKALAYGIAQSGTSKSTQLSFLLCSSPLFSLFFDSPLLRLLSPSSMCHLVKFTFSPRLQVVESGPSSLPLLFSSSLSITPGGGLCWCLEPLFLTCASAEP